MTISPAPMSPPTVLIVGVGSIGERHVRCFRATARAAPVIVELNPVLRTQVAQRYDVPQYPSLDEALATGPRLAVICTPAPHHVSIASQCLAAGAACLIEKPLATSEQGVDELERLAASTGLPVAVAYVYRAFPELIALRHMLQSGQFGVPLQITVVGGQHFPTYRPAYKDIYYAHREQGGGAIQDALTHLLNLGEWLCGPIRRLACDSAHLVLPGVEVEDTVHLLARHIPRSVHELSPARSESTLPFVMGSYAINQHQAPNETSLQIVCTGGTLRCELHRQKLLWMTQPGGEWQFRDFEPRERDDLYIAQAHAFLDTVEGRSPPACTLAEGRQTLRVNLAALRAVDSHKWESVD